ncbi:hypothetical protein DL546_000836 [Coniochaeta pulveracea]|uniref:Ribosome biogenesis protein SLX9 n=1 Tax=Coniochaeta pulveracea TaxID=177199 RepID=A0A420XWJ2_9PEZI|nr:hypothetical protein DL546_000836 [Coniochaeta pulveracea]
MAPTAPPGKRPTARQKALQRLANPTLPRKTHRPEAIVPDSFIESKKDKRLIKHSAFVSKIAKPSTSKKLKRRRPNKKLVATLDSLGDVLDEIVEEEGEGKEGEVRQEGKTRHRSLKSRPGALKKKEKLVRGEMERFGKSLAQLQQMTGEQDKGPQTETTAPVPSTSSRWAALRGFISATMEQNPAFVGKT